MSRPRNVGCTDGRRNNGPRRNPSAPPQERFFRFVEQDEWGCWNWTGRRYREGYGQFNPGRKWGWPAILRAHHFAYEAFVGPVPDGHQLDHLCRNRACCHPRHLEAVPPVVNNHRGDTHARKQACPQGHPYDTENTYRYTDKHGYTRRYCRSCQRQRIAALAVKNRQMDVAA